MFYRFCYKQSFRKWSLVESISSAVITIGYFEDMNLNDDDENEYNFVVNGGDSKPSQNTTWSGKLVVGLVQHRPKCYEKFNYAQLGLKINPMRSLKFYWNRSSTYILEILQKSIILLLEIMKSKLNLARSSASLCWLRSVMIASPTTSLSSATWWNLQLKMAMNISSRQFLTLTSEYLLRQKDCSCQEIE